FTFRYFWIICDTLFDFIECFIRNVIPQHIMNEALFNGLPHGIEVKRFERAIWFLIAESLYSLWLWCRCECKEGNIRLITTFRNGLKHPFFCICCCFFFHLTLFIGFFQCFIRKQCSHGRRRFPALGAVGFIYDDPIGAPVELPYFV